MPKENAPNDPRTLILESQDFSGTDQWIWKDDKAVYPSIYKEAGENFDSAVAEPDEKGNYTWFWGGRNGHALASGHLAPEKASELCIKSGFTNWQRRNVSPQTRPIDSAIEKTRENIGL